MIKIEAITLEDAYSKAAKELDCSVAELVVEVVQYPSSGLLGLFRKKAIIVATIDKAQRQNPQTKQEETQVVKKEKEEKNIAPKAQEQQKEQPTSFEEPVNQEFMQPPSFVSSQEESYEDEVYEEEQEVAVAIESVIDEIKEGIDSLFERLCFDIDSIEVSVYDETTVYIEINGEDAALLIGKEGYRYKALSYMLFNWINSKYGLQLRLEIAEFLKNQEEAVYRYLESVKEAVDLEGRAQTKILDGVLVQIALKELRATYPNKYVAIRTTRDGLKYIIINDYHY